MNFAKLILEEIKGKNYKGKQNCDLSQKNDTY